MNSPTRHSHAMTDSIGGRWAPVALLALLWTLAGCAGDASLSVRDAWARAAPPSAPATAMYLTIENGTTRGDTLLSASSPACTATELHEMYEREPGVMGMRQVGAGIAVPAGGAVSLEPGGLHVMCIGPTTSFDVGASLELTLTLAVAGDLPVTVTVREAAP